MQKSNLTKPSYDQTTFNDRVTDVFNSLGGVRTGTTQTVTVKRDSGITVDGSIPTTSVPLVNNTIGVSLTLGELTNVDIHNLSDQDVIVYDESSGSWINRPGLSGLSAPITALSDVAFDTLSGLNNHLLKVNRNGTSIITIADNYISGKQLVNGPGIILRRPTTNGLRAELNSNTITEEFASNRVTDFFVNTNANVFSKIKQSTIDVTRFYRGADPYIRRNNFKHGSGICITYPGTSSIKFSVSSSAFPFNLNSTSGILAIRSGGTEARTSASARTNLELDYNVHVLSVSGPSFRNRLRGDNIILKPFTFTVSPNTGLTGANYTTGYAHLISNLNGSSIRVFISGTGPGGGVSRANLELNGNSITSRIGDAPTFSDYYTLNQGTTNGASFFLTPEPQYINFGPSTGSTGFGVRNKHGIIELKNSVFQSEGASWTQILPLTLSTRLSDVQRTSLDGNSAGATVIWTGSQFKILQLSGGISSINSNGRVGLCLALNSINNLEGISPGITSSNINFLSGLDDNIIVKLREKVGISPESATNGDLLYYSTPGPSKYLPLSFGHKYQILGNPDIGTPGPSFPTYKPVYNYFGISNSHIDIDISNDTRIPVYTYGLSRCPLYTLENIFGPLVNGISTGLEYSNNPSDHIRTNINRLQTTTTINETYFLAVNQRTPSSTSDNKIRVSDFNRHIAGEGLCVLGVSITIGDLSHIQFSPRTYGTSRSFGPRTGAMAYFKDSVNNNLAVYNGLCWMTLQFGPSIVNPLT